MGLFSNRKLKRDEKGFALVAAIWLSGLMMVIAVGFATNLRLNTLLGANRIHQAELTSIAEGMVRYKAWRLSTAQSLALGDGQELCQWNDKITVQTFVQDHAGLVDLNLSPPALLALGFEAVGADTKLAEALALEVIDYRDVDRMTVSGGTEALNRDGTSPSNRRYEVVEELDLLPSMTDAIYRKSKRLFSIYAGQPGVDFTYLPLEFEVGFSAESKALFAAVSPRRSFSVTAMAQNANGLSYGVQADVILIQQPDQPFALLTWNYVSGGPTSASAISVNAPRCIN